MKSMSLIGILVLTLCGCPNDKPTEASVEKSTLSPRRVMVIDSDFDQSLPVFKGKIAGTYTMYCDRKENRCELRKGLQYRPKQDARVLALREKWNKAVKERNFSSLTPDEVQYMNKNMVRSHGTSAATLVAYKNPNVQLYLVQQKEKSDSDQKNPTVEFRELCSDPAKLNQIAARIQYNQAHWAQIINGINPEEQAIYDFAMENDIDLINKSYGTVGPDAYVRQMFAEMRCPIVAEMIIQNSRILHAQIDNMRVYDSLTPYLIIQSAGNEGSEINSDHDTAECMIQDGNHLLIGSYDSYDRVSRFSNYGDCVSFYALGSQVISSTVGDLLSPVDGTSFSAPLAVRFLTTFPSKQPARIKYDLKRHIDHRRFVKMDLGDASDIVFERGGRGPSLVSAAMSSGTFYSQEWREENFLNDVLRQAHEFVGGTPNFTETLRP